MSNPGAPIAHPADELSGEKASQRRRVSTHGGRPISSSLRRPGAGSRAGCAKPGAVAAAALLGATAVAAPAEAAFVKTAISFPYVAYGQDLGSYRNGIINISTSRTGQVAVPAGFGWVCRRQAWQMVEYPYNPGTWTFSSQSPYYSGCWYLPGWSYLFTDYEGGYPENVKIRHKYKSEHTGDDWIHIGDARIHRYNAGSAFV
jgi:hypothetical protein